MKTQKRLTIGSGVLMALVGLGAVIGGIMLMIEPKGTSLSLSLDLLKGSPFNDYYIPGILLLSLIGILSLVGSYLLFKNYKFAGISEMILGAVLIVWIAAQVYWIGWGNLLQPTFIAIGVIEIALGFMIQIQHHGKWSLFGGHPNLPAH
jgi:hypothetical protein